MRRALAMLVVGLLLAPVAAGAKVRVDRKGPRVSPTTATDWLRHPDEARSYQESWTAILRSHAGHALYVSFIYTNLGVLEGSTAVAVSVTPPGGKASAHRFDHGVDDYSQSAKAGRIAIGPDSMALKDGRLKLVVREKGLRLDVDLKAWMPGVKLHNGRIWLDDDRSDWVRTYFHVPRGSFEGTLEAGGRKERLTGDGYVDHLVQNVIGPEYSTHWWTVRLFAPKHTLAFLVWRTPKDLDGGDVVHMVLTDDKEVLAFGDRMRLRTSGLKEDPEGHRYATRFAVSWSGKGVSLKGTVKSKRLHERDAVLERLSWMERKVAGLVAGNPVMYRMEGEAQLTLIRDGAEVPIAGTALMESLVLGEDD